ncbi:hypothetical protein GCM10009117_08540 [Gangjinia marincola]|uniref:Type II secretion system protein n=1 Tax=Gangjinia marincola TaxID=578463 RepID=A0ABP3XQU8_9FLAO
MPLFNSSRSFAIKQKRLFNYLLYALGEIILVVTGILIALYINNQSELSKKNRELMNSAKLVYSAMARDTLVIHQFFQESHYRVSQNFLSYLDRPYDSSAVMGRGGKINMILFDMYTPGLTNEVEDIVTNAPLNNSALANQLNAIRRTYTSNFEIDTEVKNLVFDTSKENLAYLSETQPWYTDFMLDRSCNDDCINFLNNNVTHKKLATKYYFYYTTLYKSSLQKFKRSIIKQMEQLKPLLKA